MFECSEQLLFSCLCDIGQMSNAYVDPWDMHDCIGENGNVFFWTSAVSTQSCEFRVLSAGSPLKQSATRYGMVNI